MSLRIMMEPTTIRDEQVHKEAYRFTVVRLIGTHPYEAARFVIPKDPNETPFLGDIYIATRVLDLLKNDVENDPDIGWFDWFKRQEQRELLKLLWQIYNRINYSERSADEGFKFLSDSQLLQQSSQTQAQHQDSEEVLRKRALTLLCIREPDIRFDLAQLRKKLFKDQKRWLVSPTGAQ